MTVYFSIIEKLWTFFKSALGIDLEKSLVR